jgi:hypothetical protein
MPRSVRVCGDGKLHHAMILFQLMLSRTFYKVAGKFLRVPEERALQELDVSDAYWGVLCQILGECHPVNLGGSLIGFDVKRLLRASKDSY